MTRLSWSKWVHWSLFEMKKGGKLKRNYASHRLTTVYKSIESLETSKNHLFHELNSSGFSSGSREFRFPLLRCLFSILPLSLAFHVSSSFRPTGQKNKKQFLSSLFSLRPCCFVCNENYLFRLSFSVFFSSSCSLLSLVSFRTSVANSH